MRISSVDRLLRAVILTCSCAARDPAEARLSFGGIHGSVVCLRHGGSSQLSNRKEVKLLSRIDTAIEVDYFRHGGILPYVLRELIQGNKT